MRGSTPGRGQERALERLRQTLAEPQARGRRVRRAVRAAPIGEADAGLLGMATGESLACLNYLLHRGEVDAATIDADGVAWYRPGRHRSRQCGRTRRLIWRGAR